MREEVSNREPDIFKLGRKFLIKLSVDNPYEKLVVPPFLPSKISICVDPNLILRSVNDRLTVTRIRNY